MNERLTIKEIEMQEAAEPLEEIRRLKRKTPEYKSGVREASFVILDMLKSVEAGEETLQDVMQRVNDMLYKGIAPGYPKPFSM